MLIAFYGFSLLIVRTTHFTDGKTEAQQDYVICSLSHSKSVDSQVSDLIPQSILLTTVLHRIAELWEICFL